MVAGGQATGAGGTGMAISALPGFDPVAYPLWGLPVAVKRLPAAGFPLELTLSDADGLMPAQKLSMQKRVRLLARISRSGDAAAAPGDLEAEAIELDVADGATATLRIATVRP